MPASSQGMSRTSQGVHKVCAEKVCARFSAPKYQGVPKGGSCEGGKSQ